MVRSHGDHHSMVIQLYAQKWHRPVSHQKALNVQTSGCTNIHDFFSFEITHRRMKKDHVKAKRFLLYTSILYIVFLQNAGVFLQEKYMKSNRIWEVADLPVW